MSYRAARGHKMTSRMPHKGSFGNTGSPYNMFFPSLFLHLIVFAAVIITVPATSRQLTFGAPIPSRW